MIYDSFDDDLEDEVSDEDFILYWHSCELDEDDENYEMCENCDLKEDCLESANDNCSGYESFCDSIVGSGYKSMEDFWECNGI